MNILADVHSKLYEPGISEEEYQKRRKDFLEIYYRLRHKNESTLIFKPKNVTTYQEAFAHLDQLIPRRENAFLFRR